MIINIVFGLTLLVLVNSNYLGFCCLKYNEDKDVERYKNKLVPKAGLEPARLSPLPPQDSVSTNSTTWAFFDFILVNQRIC